MGFVAVAIILCFSYASCYANLVRSEDAHVNPEMNGMVAMYHTPRGSYFGSRAKIGIWGSPNQGRFQESGASILVTSNELEDLNALEAGFHVYPDLYNDNNVHFFTHWTKDTDRSTGCYNLKCGGFVPAEGAELTPGQAVAPASTYDGDDHYISISLHTDPNSGDWVLFRDDLEKPLFLGHFPKELCPKLNGGAPRMAWTGFVSYPKNEPSPAMGSGHFPLEGERKAAYIKNIKLFDSKARAHDPYMEDLLPVLDRPDCYHLSIVDFVVKDRVYFYYGGPSGCIG
uniref:Neprosin PEP catalytic domain-containing protein n=1 Tax=Oryza nivara TaxID=4536 RepID=A0A0E0HZL6_ORYNI